MIKVFRVNKENGELVPLNIPEFTVEKLKDLDDCKKHIEAKIGYKVYLTYVDYSEKHTKPKGLMTFNELKKRTNHEKNQV